MVVIAGILGAILGVAIAALFTEVVFPNNQEWPIIFLAVGAVGGWLVFTSLVRRFANRNAKPS